MTLIIVRSTNILRQRILDHTHDRLTQTGCKFFDGLYTQFRITVAPLCPRIRVTPKALHSATTVRGVTVTVTIVSSSLAVGLGTDPSVRIIATVTVHITASVVVVHGFWLSIQSIQTLLANVTNTSINLIATQWIWWSTVIHVPFNHSNRLRIHRDTPLKVRYSCQLGDEVEAFVLDIVVLVLEAVDEPGGRILSGCGIARYNTL
mmetsp:Transcript_24130/g.36203  ORF Transcript_24130/g.36203 Transcript_24130/m.36203 type:complete len:205 (-) Transcript_24130:177-791(-)